MVIKNDTADAARAAKPKAREIFSRLGIVSGVGITRIAGRYAVKVLLEKSPAEPDKVPSSIDGVPVVLKVVGTVKAGLKAQV